MIKSTRLYLPFGWFVLLSALLLGWKCLPENSPVPSVRLNDERSIQTPRINLKPFHSQNDAPNREEAVRTGRQIASRLKQWRAARSDVQANDDLSFLIQNRRRATENVLNRFGPSYELRMDRNSGTARSLKGDLKQLVDDSEEYSQARSRGDFGSMAVALAGEIAPVLGLQEPSKELTVERVLKDRLGMTHVRLHQVLREVPIWGAQIDVHFNAMGEPVQLAGVYSTTPVMPEFQETISAERALELARRAIQAPIETTADLVQPTVKPTIYWDIDKEPVLCWDVELAPDWNQAWEIFVRQSDGAIVHRYDKIVTEAAEGLSPDMEGIPKAVPCWKENELYYAINTTLPYYKAASSSPPSVTKLRGAMYLLDFANQNPSAGYSLKNVTTPNPNEWDPSAVSLMNNLVQTERYYRSTFSLNSFDNSGMNVWAVLHWRWANAAGGSHNDNACWNQTVRCMQFGDGDSISAGRLPHALDIVAHEYTHGVTSYAANLIYENQSGAIDESLSDFFACAVDRDDWLIGEDITTYGGKTAFRDIGHPKNPDAVYQLPENMGEFRNTPVSDDHGGVHYNMSICAHAGYLLAEETNGGITREKAEQIFHRARSFYLTQRSQFADFRRACLTAAQDLYGPSSLEADAVEKSFDAVGVEESDPVQISTPGTPTIGEDAVLFLEADEDAGWDEHHDGFFCRLYSRESDTNRLVTERFTGNTLHGVSGDGKTILYVGSDYNLYVSDGADELRLTDNGVIRTIAFSKDSRTIAYTTTRFEPYVYTIDVETWTVDSVFLSVPVKDANPHALQYADVLSFNFRGDYLYFDAVSEMKLASGESFLSWGIYGMRLADRQFFMVVAQSSNEQIGNPVMANTLDRLMLADRVVFDDHDSYHLETVSIDINQGEINTLISGTTRFGQSAFTGDDNRIVYRDYDRIDQQYVLYEAPLDTSRTMLTEEPTILWRETAPISHPYGYRIGQYSVQEGKLQAPVNLVFGLLQENQILKRPITLSNAGNGDIQILGFTFEGSHPDWFVQNGGNQTIAPAQSLSLQVICQPKGGGDLDTNLVVFSTDPNRPRVSIPLKGQSQGGGPPTPNATQSAVPTPTVTPTPDAEPTAPAFAPSIVYEFDRETLTENGWKSIPGGFNNSPDGTVDLLAFSDDRLPSSQDRRGLEIHAESDRTAFLYASPSIHCGGKPALLRLTLRAESSDGVVTLGALKGDISQADGSIAYQSQTALSSFNEREGVLTLLYEPDSIVPITPIVQLAGGPSGESTVWIDRLEILILDREKAYPGSWFHPNTNAQSIEAPLASYEFDKPLLQENGWGEIPGGFNAAPNGEVNLTGLDETLTPSSIDGKGLHIVVDPGETTFLYALQPFSTNGLPALLRLTVRSNSPNAALAFGALQGPISESDGSLTTIMPQTSTFCMEDSSRSIVFYQSSDKPDITPFIQVAHSGSSESAEIWIDRLELIGLNDAYLYDGVEFYAQPQKSGVPASIAVPLPNLDIAAKPLQMIYVSPGTFAMGSPADELGRASTDEAMHRVTLTNSFYAGRFEITQAHWAALMGSGDPEITLDLANQKNNPVLNVCWFDAVRFCNRLSQSQGLAPAYDESTGAFDPSSNGFRLPTEAEWEYICRAGSSTRFFWGDDEDGIEIVYHARCASVDELGVGFPRLSNAWGFWDASGNAMEWCQNWFFKSQDGQSGRESEFNPQGPNAGTERALRGGGFADSADRCRSASRMGLKPTLRQPTLGFRIVKPVR